MIPRLTVKLKDRCQTELVVIACVSSTDLDQTVAPLEALSRRERRHYSQLRHPIRRQHYLLGRLAAKTAVAERINHKDLTKISIESGRFGQPVLRGSSNYCTSVTISHTHNSALAIAHDSGHPLGVDIENVSRKRCLALGHQRMPARILNPTCCFLSELQLFHLIWSVREAMSKALLCGITCSPAVLDIDIFKIQRDGICIGDFTHFKQYQFCAWLSHSFAISIVCSKKAGLGRHLHSIKNFTRTNLRT